MKKFIITSFIVFCCVISVGAQDIVNLRMDRQQMGLRGLVASMDEDILVRKDYFREDWPERKWFVKDLRKVLREDEGRIVTFNNAGRMTTITYTHQGKKGKTTKCSYASNGLLTSFLGEGYKVEAKYKGNFADINVYAETKDYSSKVNIAKADLNKAPYTNTYPFDLKCRQELTDDGLVLRSNYYYVDSLPAKVCEYNYNHLNLLMSERITEYSDGEVNVTVVRYKYDNQNFLTEKVVKGKAYDETWSYHNNELGDCVRLTIERPYGKVEYKFYYEYDTNDNWTVRLQFQNGIFDNAAIRTLTYHKAAKEKTSNDGEKSIVDKLKFKKKSDEVTDKEAKAKLKAEAKAEKARLKEAEDNMTKEERKAAKAEQKLAAKAAKEQAAAAKKAEKELKAAEKKAAKEREALEKKAAKENK